LEWSAVVTLFFIADLSPTLDQRCHWSDLPIGCNSECDTNHSVPFA